MKSAMEKWAEQLRTKRFTSVNFTWGEENGTGVLDALHKNVYLRITFNQKADPDFFMYFEGTSTQSPTLPKTD